MENGAEWRFFEGLKRHFAVPGADGARSQPASLADLTSVASNCIEPASAPGNRSRAPFFTSPRRHPKRQAGGPDRTACRVSDQPPGTEHVRDVRDFAEGDAHAVAQWVRRRSPTHSLAHTRHTWQVLQRARYAKYVPRVRSGRRNNPSNSPFLPDRNNRSRPGCRLSPSRLQLPAMIGRIGVKLHESDRLDANRNREQGCGMAVPSVTSKRAASSRIRLFPSSFGPKSCDEPENSGAAAWPKWSRCKIRQRTNDKGQLP